MKLCVTFATVGLLLAVAAAQTSTTKPADDKAKTTTAPTVDPEVRKILDAMEAAGKTTKTIQAALTYKAINTKLGVKELRTGWVAYQGKQTVKAGDKTITVPAMFRVHFETIKMGVGKTRKDPVDYSFDGKTLTIARARTKTVTRFQLPKGKDNADAMQIGKGPMPLPFGQKTADMIKYFVCTTGKTRLKNTDYLKLVPRKEHARSLNTTEVRMWSDKKTHLPVKITTKMKTKDTITSTFSKIDLDKPIKKTVFTIPKPRGWKLVVQPLKPGQNIKP